jgi:hypothetical protein
MKDLLSSTPAFGSGWLVGWMDGKEKPIAAKDNLYFIFFEEEGRGALHS